MKVLKSTIAAFALLFFTACCSHHKTPGETVETADATSVQELEGKIGDRVFFALNESTLSTEAKNTLARQSEFMKSHPDLKFVIEGHCDERGTREYNLALGERRANSAMNYLISIGADPSKMTPISYGKERPAVVGHDEESWKQNRRAVTVIK
ncbi:peptidoglycan-associated lipoprotein Pal [Rickettsiales endosymbiont of Peranema trichophorum]|uniref:peptidoglycan-associated lipoprotein Pal n=1 Tax=Rickettsiales endosymbiont of Peranema trichophorum TaxID=2486577 RepID=UPI001023377A|nr:peptidoglycan-associated lipoprotein Pal [Rickettsiales endosymbiont of Peranema trichophorum]RZI47270.1 peptidoglycan-associated lipoprotein Pal [Rickettsiales endosymbiont of Peranema trichophorum]